MKKILYVGDGNGIKNLLEKYDTKYDYNEVVTDSYIEKSIAFRHINYLKTALRGLLSYKDSEYIIFWQQYIALYFVFILKLLPFQNKSKKIYIYYILYKKSGNSLINNIKERLFLYLIKDKRVIKVVFLSSSDYLFSKINDSKKIVVDFIAKYSEDNNLHVKNTTHEKTDSYFFSGGTSNRDYKLLINAFDDLNKRLVICCKPKDINVKKIPNNIDIFFDKYDEEFDELLFNSSALVIAFEDKVTNSGQYVILKALQYGKMVFVQNCATINEGLWNIKNKSFVRVFDSKETLVKLIEEFDNENQSLYSEDAKRHYELMTEKNIFMPVLDEIMQNKAN